MKHLRELFYVLFSGIFFLVVSNNIYSQDIEKFEKEYKILGNELNSEQLRLDSLQNILRQRAELINKEKRKSPQDKDEIINLMSNSATISNNIEAEQKKLYQLENKIELLKSKLGEKYSFLIDSLKSLKKNDKITEQVISLFRRNCLFLQK